MKKYIQKWLEIKPPIKPIKVDESKIVDNISKTLLKEWERKLASLKAVNCIVCNKPLIEGRDSVYTDFKGKKFCSHECIDKNVE